MDSRDIACEKFAYSQGTEGATGTSHRSLGAMSDQETMPTLHGIQQDCNNGELPLSTNSSSEVALGTDDSSGQTPSLMVTAPLITDDDNVIPHCLEEPAERKMQQGIESRFQAHAATMGVAEAVVPSSNDTSGRVDGLNSSDPKETRCPSLCALRPQSLCILVLIGIVLMGGIVTGVVVAFQKGTEPVTSTTIDPALSTRSPIVQSIADELELWIIRGNEDRTLFQDPSSPQSRALDWLSADNITLSKGRSPTVVLERYILAVLYFSTNGPNWLRGYDLDFLTQEQVCNWNNNLPLTDFSALGIFCGNESHVESIVLDQVALSGTIPWELSLLSNLTLLSVTENFLMGSIPTEIGQLTALRWINFQSNVLTGTLPTELGHLLELRSFTVSNNSLTGTVPTEFNRLTQLSKFWIRENSLTGTVAPLLATLTSLVSVALDTNWFTGTLPTELGQLSALVELWMFANTFTGTLPTELGKLTSITWLAVASNSLTGTIPTELGQMTALALCVMSNNTFTGTIPTELGNLTGISFLYLDENSLTGTLPTELGNMTGIASLHFDENSLSGTLPVELGNLVQLQVLHIYGNTLTGSVPTSLSELKNLNKFLFHKNSLTGSVNGTLCAAGATHWETLQSDCLATNGEIEIDCICCNICCHANGVDCQDMT